MKRLVCLILSLLFLTGCANVIPSEYATVKPHVESSGKTAQEDAVVVSNYPQLKNAILRFVQECRSEGYIRVNTYDGDVERDLAEAAYEVSRVEPLGVYAVDYMTHECTRIVSYYDIRINITFRRTAAEIAAIESVGTQVLLQRRLQQAVEDGERRVTLRMSSYRDQDIAAMVAEYCADNPAAVMEVPDVAVSLYPESGPVRILEITFTYSQPQEALREKQQAVQESIRSAASYIRYRATDRGKAELLYTYLTTRFIYVEQATTTPLYSALCAGIADAYGLAQAWKLICDQVPVDCYVVNGLRDGEPWTWNIVSYDGYYRHLDLHSCMMEEDALALRTDEEMSRYYWNTNQYPACDPMPTQEPEIPEQTTDNLMVETETPPAAEEVVQQPEE